MGWVQEVVDLVSKLSFCTIVHEYEQGLFLRGGRVIDKKIRWWGKDLEEIAAGERKIARQYGGKLSLFLSGFLNPEQEFPEHYKRSFLGLPKHSKRYEKKKVLEPGVYFNFPIFERIYTDSQQERVLNLGNIGVPTADDDSKQMQISCNVRCRLLNLYKAFTAVHDYETSLKDYTLSILAKHSRGKTYAQWKDSAVIEKLEEDVKKELRKLVTEKWGLEIFEVYVTDNVTCNYQRVAYEGNPLPIQKAESSITQ